MRPVNRVKSSAMAALLVLAGCGQHSAGDVTEARLLADKGDSGNWLTGGNGWRGMYYSGLRGIDASNAKRLGLAWQYDLNQTRGQEATPVVVDGVLYVSTNWGHVAAMDAETGKELWTYDPEVDGQWGRYACCDVVNRGVAVANGVVYVGSTDNYMHAIDAATGKRLWKVDILDAEARAKHMPYTTSGAPQVAGDVVVIGNGGADYGVRGFVRAFDLKTGARKWTFWAVPHDPKNGPQERPYLDAALKTWDPQSDWSKGGGGTAWDGMAYDPVLKLLYVGTGNASPYNYLDRSKGKGDNLYLASIVAIDPKTGVPRWHYQTVPGEYWDYTATAKMILADLKIGGKTRHVLMQAPKDGFFYVLDRATGELISAKPYTYQNWAKGIDLKTGRPIFNPDANYMKSPKLVYPSMIGGHNWYPMSYSPDTGLVYIPVVDAPMIYVDIAKRPIRSIPGAFTSAGLMVEDYDPKALQSMFGDLPVMADLARTAGGPGKPASQGFIRAWDPVRGRVVWQTRARALTEGGVMSTAGGLVFSGDITGHLNIRRADTGALVRSIDTGGAIMAAPMTYTVKGQQYVAITVGMGGAGNWLFAPDTAGYKYGNEGRVLAFKLDGGPVPLPKPVPPARFEAPPRPPAFLAAEAIRGELLFTRKGCSGCHVPGRGLVPDLRRISDATHENFNKIVLEGAYASMGMGSFADIVTPGEAKAIHAYISREQLALYKQETNPTQAKSAPARQGPRQ
ncbi:PQQ-dependent dehydrogenase, methanol/ethanol family [Novosphingobium sp. FKTRR1]|uniref:PQQ-dependent dehydrogenase, methanol/ethanol family n=1 Tax=Novosphingobium sp. FKTRR1 TaxID=2879118 RepID=UPI001CF0362B|nr:PQQ-dependent dehydrogenase, methanol/ethanol family [Novosphingobium sp. FKTRR1]